MISASESNANPSSASTVNNDLGTEQSMVCDKRNMPRYMSSTTSSNAKRRDKVPISGKRGFDNISRSKSNIPTIPTALLGLKSKTNGYAQSIESKQMKNCH